MTDCAKTHLQAMHGFNKIPGDKPPDPQGRGGA